MYQNKIEEIHIKNIIGNVQVDPISQVILTNQFNLGRKLDQLSKMLEQKLS